jgi:hypothetical protein
VTVGAGTMPPFTAPAPPLAALRARLAATGPGGAERLVAGGPPPAGLALVNGDLVVPGIAYGAGILHVTGTLDIQGRLDFTGMVVAEQGLRVEAGAQLTVRGGLWLGPLPGGPPLAVDGLVEVRRDAAAVDAADALLALPRRARLAGVRDPA